MLGLVHQLGDVTEPVAQVAALFPASPRDTVTELAREHCRTSEDFRAWSQNIGHEDVLTTFRSYGRVPPGRQMDLMARFRKRGPLQDEDGFDVFE